MKVICQQLSPHMNYSHLKNSQRKWKRKINRYLFHKIKANTLLKIVFIEWNEVK